MKKLLPIACLATVFTMGYHKAKSQDDTDRKVRIQITTREDGSTNTVTREFDLSDEQALEDALREMGVFEEMGLINDGEDLVIDLKRLHHDGSVLKDMCLALAIDPEEWMPDDRAFLGVYTGQYGEDGEGKKMKGVKEGACITEVIDDTPAQRAGLQEGDVITAIDDRAVSSHETLVAALETYEPGDEVEVTYYRDAKKNTANATLAAHEMKEHLMVLPPDMNYDFEMPDEEWELFFEKNWTTEKHAFLGVDGADVEGGGGARITEVIEGTNAESMGIEEGDIIHKVNDTRVVSFGTLAEIIGTMEPGASVAIEVERNGTTSTMHGTLGEMELPSWTEIPVPPDAPDAPEPPYPHMYRMPRMAPQDRDELRREMDQLREEMDRLRQELRGEVLREMTVVIGTIELSPAETEVLKTRGVTGLDNTLELPDLRCFPNPSNGSFHLSFEASERGDLNVDIHDAAGERMYHETITGFKGRYERTLDLSDQSDGAYFMVIGQNGRALARKLVKQ